MNEMDHLKMDHFLWNIWVFNSHVNDFAIAILPETVFYTYVYMMNMCIYTSVN